MFDIELEGKPPIRESDFIEPGKEIVPPFDTAVGKVGMAICFDLRFPEIALRLKRLGAEVLLYPSAFTVPTGKAHWEALLRGRAIECQCYVSCDDSFKFKSPRLLSIAGGVERPPCRSFRGVKLDI